MQNGVIVYEEKIPLVKDESVSHAITIWKNRFSSVDRQYQPVILSNIESGHSMKGTILFKVDIPQTGNYFWLKATVFIFPVNNSLALQVRDFYEKPIEKGVSNDYSKIEYRWWDFRHARPWSNEDESLFIGLDQKTRNFIELVTKGQIVR
jgi:hypothetical protein